MSEVLGGGFTRRSFRVGGGGGTGRTGASCSTHTAPIWLLPCLGLKKASRSTSVGWEREEEGGEKGWESQVADGALCWRKRGG